MPRPTISEADRQFILSIVGVAFAALLAILELVPGETAFFAGLAILGVQGAHEYGLAQPRPSRYRKGER